MTRNEYSNTNASLFFALLICFFIGIHSYYNKFGSGARQPAGLHSISCLSYNKRSNWLATHSLVLPCP